MILRELLTVLGFKADDKALKAYDAKVIDLKKNLLLVTAAAAAVATAIFGITESAAKAGDVLDKTKDLTGLSVEELQRLRGAAKLAGVDVDGLTTGLQLFSRQISAAAQGQQMSIRAFQMLGINIFAANGKLKDNHTLLLQVADAFSKLQNQQVRTDLAMQLFGRSGGRMVNLLKKGAVGIKEAEAEFSKFGFTINEIQSKQAAQFEDRMSMVGFVIKGLKNAIGFELLPELSRMIDLFLKWFSANKKIITQNIVNVFKSLAAFVKIVADIFGAVLLTVTHFVNIFGGWNRVLKVTALLLGLIVSSKIIRGLAAIGKGVILLVGNFKKLVIVEGIADALLAIWPAIAIAIALVADDIKNFLEGNNSLIGEFIKKFPMMGQALIEFGRIFRWVFGSIAHIIEIAVINPLKLAWGLISDIGIAVEKLLADMARIKHPFANIGQNLASFLSPMGMVAPIAATAGAGATNRSVTNHINTNVHLQVPEGTPDQQKGFLQQAAERTFDKLFQGHLKAALTRFPLME